MLSDRRVRPRLSGSAFSSTGRTLVAQRAPLETELIEVDEPEPEPVPAEVPVERRDVALLRRQVGRYAHPAEADILERDRALQKVRSDLSALETKAEAARIRQESALAAATREVQHERAAREAAARHAAALERELAQLRAAPAPVPPSPSRPPARVDSGDALARAEAEATRWRRDAEMARLDVAALSAKNDALLQELSGLRKRKLSEADPTLPAQLDAALARVRELEARAPPSPRTAPAPERSLELARLQAERRSTLLLQEQRNDLERKVEAMQGEAVAAQRLRVENAALREQLEGMDRALGGVAELGSAEGVRRHIADLQAAQAAGIERESALRAERAALEKRVAALTAEAAALRAEAAAAHSTASAAAADLSATKEQLEVALGDAESLRSLMGAYDGEDALAGAAIDAAKARRLADAEGALDALRRLTQAQQGALARHAEQAAAAEERAAAQAAESARLQEAVAAAEGVRWLLGDFDPATTKVLHLRDNPLARSSRAALSSELGALQAANEQLQAQVRLLGDGGATAALAECGTLRAQITAQQQQLAALQQQLDRSDKAKDRFLDVFNQKFTEFKKAVTQLFGYRIELKGAAGDMYMLYPLPTASREHYFVFQYDKRKDAILMLDSEYARQWQPYLDRYLAQRNSYPAFMAAVMAQLTS